MIHETAVVDARAVVSASAEIGPYCVLGPDVVVSDGVRLLAHVVIDGHTTIGEGTIVHPFAALGGAPQHRGDTGEGTRLEIGADCVVREHVTIHRGTKVGRGVTTVGARVYLMSGVHVAHDCAIGDDCTLAGGTQLAGHVVLEEAVVTGGAAACAQFVRVGGLAFLAAGARVEHGIPPFHIAQGDRARVRALNEVGLERNGVPETSRAALRRAHRVLYRDGLSLAAAVSRVAEQEDDVHVRRLLTFLDAHVCAPGASRP